MGGTGPLSAAGPRERPTPLADLVATADRVATTSARSAKVAALSDLLGRLTPDEVPAAVAFLTGEPRQGKVGVGWRTIVGLAVEPAAAPTLVVGELDAALDALVALGGPGSGGARERLLTDLLRRATAPEGDFVRRLLVGELRQGALEGVMVEAVARAAGVPAAAVRRAHMLGGRLGPTATAALVGGEAALSAIGLEVGRPVRPMLASTAGGVAAALAELGEASVEWKLDGARIQVHRRGDEVAVFTRNLNDVTRRLPDVVEAVLALPVGAVVLDGETLTLGDDDRPRSFQDTMARFGTDRDAAAVLRPWFFDCLHRDGVDLVDEPFRDRLAVLDEVAGHWRTPGVVTDDVVAAEAVQTEALAAGHEGVMVKAVGSPYAAGRRGKAWQKVKPVHTVDLVVLAVEWGSGRRRGWLSNLHLGARRPDGGFVMVGKTFKGLTDALLGWQTERFLALETSRRNHVVHVAPEQVVEIALDGVQRSTRYPGGIALRFARVVSYRPDKTPAEADAIDDLRALLPGPGTKEGQRP